MSSALVMNIICMVLIGLTVYKLCTSEDKD